MRRGTVLTYEAGVMIILASLFALILLSIVAQPPRESVATAIVRDVGEGGIVIELLLPDPEAWSLEEVAILYRRPAYGDIAEAVLRGGTTYIDLYTCLLLRLDVQATQDGYYISILIGSAERPDPYRDPDGKPIPCDPPTYRDVELVILRLRSVEGLWREIGVEMPVGRR